MRFGGEIWVAKPGFPFVLSEDRVFSAGFSRGFPVKSALNVGICVLNLAKFSSV